MNPDPDTTRVVRAEAFERRVAQLMATGFERSVAELQVAFEAPHLACAYEQLRQPVELHDALTQLWLGD